LSKAKPTMGAAVPATGFAALNHPTGCGVVIASEAKQSSF
jgi:hypothetical protein